ncbi:isoprenoid synthase domain-containing protein [Multifurca ochricompacta]|uniref:Isoprenoid synthase domain-containing protein n=1 Tax=Multifurca ochricompacta TaxID=376703 RepID=A0AAD4M219_9AGAM|nr:isoprenoid synthase domain-containing protein [Multifurca ochricompacta]
MIYLFDEYIDRGNEDEAQEKANIGRTPCTTRTPLVPMVNGSVVRSSDKLAIKTASPQSQKRFIEAFDIYSEAVVQQAANRDHKHIHSIQEYIEVRRQTIGAWPVFALIELDMNLPDEAVHHSAIEQLSVLAVEMIWVANVVARGDDNHNIITSVMLEKRPTFKGL